MNIDKLSQLSLNTLKKPVEKVAEEKISLANALAQYTIAAAILALIGSIHSFG